MKRADPPVGELLKQVKAACPDKTLFFTRGTLSLPNEVTALFDSWIDPLNSAPADRQIIVRNCKITQQGQTVVASGQAESVPFAATDFTGIFFFDEAQKVQLAATATARLDSGDDSWSLGKAFPAILDEKNPENAYLDQLSFQDPTSFTLASATYEEIPGGFNFTGSMLFSGRAGQAAFLFPLDAALTMKGPVTGLYQQVPQLQWDGESKVGVPFGSFGKLVMMLRLRPLAGRTPPPLVIGLYAESQLRYSGDKEFPIWALLPSSMSDPVQFGGDLTDVNALGLSALSKLADATNLLPYMPQRWPLPDLIRPSVWTAVPVADPVDPTKPPTLTFFSLTLEAPKPWVLIPGQLELSDFKLEMTRQQDIMTDDVQYGMTVLGAIVLDPDANPPSILQLSATLPNFAFTGYLENTLPIKRLGKFFGDEEGKSLPDLTVTSLYLSLDPNSSNYSFTTAIRSDEKWSVPIGPADFQLQTIGFSISSLAKAVDAQFQASFWLFPNPDDPSKSQFLVGVKASYTSPVGSKPGGWIFYGSISKVDIDFGQVIKKYFPRLDGVDPGTLSIDKAAVTINRIDQSYTFELDATLTLNLGLDRDNPSLRALVDVTTDKNSLSTGFVEGVFDYSNIHLSVRADLLPDQKKPVYTFKYGSRLTAKYDPNISALVIYYDVINLGEILRTLIEAAMPGSGIGLPPPWDVLDSISFDHPSLALYLKEIERHGEFETNINVDFGFVSIKRIQLAYWPATKTSKSKVTFKIVDGKFLNTVIDKDHPMAPWDTLNPDAAPAVPGMGASKIRLFFLAFGQRVNTKVPLDKSTIRAAGEQLQTAFKDPPGSKDSALTYAPGVNWMIALGGDIVETIDFKIVFIDPDLYGISFYVDGPAAPAFNGLRFEVYYKKVTDTIGVYHVELQLPDAMRTLWLGPLIIVLPSFSLSVYTNGSFLLDVGFPQNDDWTRCFGITWSIYAGSGGFYIGRLEDGVATQVPGPCTNGYFSPVTLFGLALALGFERKFNSGPLSAGLSLMLRGSIEGVFAYFEYYPGSLPVPPPSDKPLYYWVRGKLALVGQVYGQIDFCIITARLDFIAQISAAVQVEIYKAMIFEFTASATVRVSVRINLGLFKITIHLSYTASVSSTFSVGSDDPNTPWHIKSARMLPSGLRVARMEGGDCATVPVLKWQIIKLGDAPRSSVSVTMAPQLTALSPGAQVPSQAAVVAMMFVQSSQNQTSLEDGMTDFDRVAAGAFLWAASAYVNREKEPPLLKDLLDAPVTADGMRALFCGLTAGPTLEPFTAQELDDFLSNYFAFTISRAVPPPSDAAAETSVSVLPIFPQLTLAVSGQEPLHFDDYNKADEEQLQKIRDYFQKLAQRAAPPQAVRLGEGTELSLARFMFMDYFTLLAKQGAQAAIDLLSAPMEKAGPDHALIDEDFARRNQAAPLRVGAVLDLPPHDTRLPHGEDAPAGARRALSPVGDKPPFDLYVIEGAKFTVPAGGETLLGVSRRFGVTLEALAAANQGTSGLFAYDLPLSEDEGAMKLGDLVTAMKTSGKFENMAGMAARVFVQGLRPPWKEQGLSALYDLSGQQFDPASYIAGEPFALSVEGEPAWLQFQSPTPWSLSVNILPQEKALLPQLQGQTLSPQARPESLSPYQMQPKRFTVSRPTVWKTAASSGEPVSPTLWTFPANLQSLLLSDPSLRPKVSVNDESKKRSSGPHMGGPQGTPGHVWATSLQITLRRSPSNDGSGDLDGVYEMLGSDAAGGKLLENLLSDVAGGVNPIANVHILYRPKPGDPHAADGLVSAPAGEAQFFLLQTNLSTATNPPQSAQGEAVDDLDFIKKLWEGTIVRSGGYSLQYRFAGAGLPDYLFEKDGSVEITILITYTIADDILRDYLNTVVITDSIDLETTVVYLRAEEQSRVGVQPAPDETLADLAWRHRRTVAELAELNKDKELEAGQALGALTPRPGDTLAGLAKRSGLALAALAVANRGRSVRLAGGWSIPEVLLDRVTTMPVGSAGFVVTRPKPSDEGVPTLYNLLGYRIAGLDGFTESNYGLPLSPADPDDAPPPQGLPWRAPKDDGDTWTYTGVIPVYTSAPMPPPDPEVPDPANDPYRGVGKTATIQFVWLDLFGNTIMQDPCTLPVPVVFFDDLIGLDRWPGVGADYFVKNDASGNPTLYAELAFDSSRYAMQKDETPDSWTKRLQTDRDVLASVYYQLANKMSAKLACTLDGEAGLDFIEDVTGFVLALWRYLGRLITAGSYTPMSLSLPLSRPVADASGRDKLELTASLVLRRPPELVDPRYQDPLLDAALVEPCSLKPRSGPLKPLLGEDPNQTMREFALALETAFPDLKVATALPVVKEKDDDSTRNIWLVRFGQTTGYGYAFTGAPLFYAIPPLSHQPLSSEVRIRTYHSGTPIESEPALPQSFSNMDLDASASAFLDAVELFLSPPYGVPAWTLLPDQVKEVLEAKKAIAHTVASRVTNIYDDQAPTAGGLTAAADKVRQELLISLSSAYTFDAVVQLAAQVRSPDHDPKFSPNLFGKPVSPEGDQSSQAFSLSTAKVSLNDVPDSSHMSFLFTSRDKKDAAVVELPLSYKVSSMEHELHSVPGIKDYVASSWLSFILPMNGPSLGPVRIPVLLRAIPTPASMIDQKAGLYSPQGADLPTLRHWDYVFSYEYAPAAQDAINGSVQFNVVKPERGPRGTDEEPSLFEALAQFTQAYPAVAKDLDLLLQPAPNPGTVEAAVQSFAWLVNRVAGAWKRWPREASRASTPELTFLVEQSSDTVEGVPGALVLSCKRQSGRFEPPQVDIEGYTSQLLGSTMDQFSWYYVDSQGNPLLFEAARDLTRRQLSVKHLDVLDQQNAWGGVGITRNAKIDEKKVNDVFIYRTPVVRFIDTLTPLLAPDITLNLADYLPAPPRHTLAEYLRTFFTQLYAGSSAQGNTKLKLTGSFEYGLQASVPLGVSLPVFITTPVDAAGFTVVDDAAQYFMDWAEEKHLTGKPGTLRFTALVYSDLGPTPLPILKLESAVLDATLIWPAQRRR